MNPTSLRLKPDFNVKCGKYLNGSAGEMIWHNLTFDIIGCPLFWAHVMGFERWRGNVKHICFDNMDMLMYL